MKFISQTLKFQDTNNISSIHRVQQALQTHDCDAQIKQLDDSALTAQQAAIALGCDVARIVFDEL